MTFAESFPPLAAKHATVLVLGSMPGRASLDAQRYYAHPRNAFWPIMAALYGFDVDAEYAARAAAVTDAGVAVWDVLQSCERPGSLDADIVEASIVANDFDGFFCRYPGVRNVFFNGAKAEQSYKKHVLPTLDERQAALPRTRLPSTSPAHAGMRFQDKLEQWRQIHSAF